MNPEELMSTSEVCRHLNVSRATLYQRQARDPTFPRPVRLGQSSFYPTADIKAWLDRKIDAVRAENAKRLQQGERSRVRR